MKRLGELVLLLVIVSVAAWSWRSSASPLQLTIAVSPFSDGSHCYYVKLNGALLECCGIQRKLSSEEMDKVARALETGRAWTAVNADYSASNHGMLYSQIHLQQGGKARQFSWNGIGPSQFRVVDSLIASPIGPELKEVIHSAAEWLRESLPLPPEPRTRRIMLLPPGDFARAGRGRTHRSVA